MDKIDVREEIRALLMELVRTSNNLYAKCLSLPYLNRLSDEEIELASEFACAARQFCFPLLLDHDMGGDELSALSKTFKEMGNILFAARHKKD